MTLPRGGDARVRIAYVFLDLGDGGAQRLTLAACRHLDRQRYVPSVLCLRGGGRLVDAAVDDGLPVHSLGRLRAPRDWRAVAAAARWFRSAGVHVAHVQLYSRAAPYALVAAQYARVPLVIGHEWCRPAPVPTSRRLADRALTYGMRFVATSASLARDLVAAGARPGDVVVIHSGIDTELFAPADRASARTRLGLPRDRRICLVPARLHPMKGHVDLLAALPLILSVVPDALVLCAGDGPLCGSLPALAAAAGLSQAVTFLGQRDDMPHLLAASDAVVLASRVEGLPAAVLEGLCAARPVVATDVGGVAEVLSSETGWLVPAHDPGLLAAAVIEALGDPERAASRAEAGRALVLARFRAEQTARRLEAAYESWLAAPRLGLRTWRRG